MSIMCEMTTANVANFAIDQLIKPTVIVSETYDSKDGTDDGGLNLTIDKSIKKIVCGDFKPNVSAWSNKCPTVKHECPTVKQEPEVRGRTKKRKTSSGEIEVDRKYPKPPPYPHTGTCAQLATLTCRLSDSEGPVWREFHRQGTEMIITKPGRRMFPNVKLQIGNTENTFKYYIYVDIVPCDSNRYRYSYCESQWTVAGKSDPAAPNRLYMHPDSPFTGEQLRKQCVSFEKIKLTNNQVDKAPPTQIILNSMHKYQPRVHIVCNAFCPLDAESLSNLKSTDELDERHFRSYIFEETQFTAVTAYQNTNITGLKIKLNPFAKGFRDGENRADIFGGLDTAARLPNGPNVQQMSHQIMLYRQFLTMMPQHSVVNQTG